MLTVNVRPSACNRSASSVMNVTQLGRVRRPGGPVVRKGELLVVEVEAGVVARLGERDQGVDVLGPARRVGEDARHAPRRHLVGDRRDDRDVGITSYRHELLGEIGGRVLIDGDRSRSRSREPERRQLTERLDAGRQVGQRVFERPVRHPRLDVEGAGPAGRGVVASPERTDGHDRQHRRSEETDDEPGAPTTVVGDCRDQLVRWRRDGDEPAEVSGGDVLQAPDQDAPWTRRDLDEVGTATTTHPAAAADRTPVGESSIATHCTGSTPRRAAASR